MATNAQRTLFSKEGKGELIKEKLAEGHSTFRALQFKIKDSPMPEGIRGARRIRRRYTRQILGGKDNSVLRAKEIMLSEIGAAVEKEKEDAIGKTQKQIRSIETAEEKLSNWPGVVGAKGVPVGGSIGFMLGMGIYTYLITLIDQVSSLAETSTLFLSICGSLTVLGMAVGGAVGSAMGADNVRSARTVAEANHESEATKIYYQWTNALVELGNKAQALVDKLD